MGGACDHNYARKLAAISYFSSVVFAALNKEPPVQGIIL